MNKSKLLFFLLLIGYSSCTNNFIYDEEKSIENSLWQYAQPLDFAFEMNDSTALFNLYLDVEHSANYPFQNLYIQLHTTPPSGKKQTDVVSLELADKAGTWFGNCSSEWCNLRIPIQQKAYFNEIGTYTLTAEPYMRRDSLPVRSFGFSVEQLEEKR